MNNDDRLVKYMQMVSLRPSKVTNRAGISQIQREPKDLL